MNANAKKWVEALRSGEFQQAQDTLRKDGAYCCLGVACELYRRETGNGKWNQHEIFVLDDYRASAVLPLPVMNWLGLASDSGEYLPHDPIKSNTCLAGDNDDGVPFEGIAEIIESEPEGLFQ